MAEVLTAGVTASPGLPGGRCGSPMPFASVGCSVLIVFFLCAISGPAMLLTAF